MTDFLERPGDNMAANAEMQLAYSTLGTVRTELLFHRSDHTPVLGERNGHAGAWRAG